MGTAASPSTRIEDEIRRILGPEGELAASVDGFEHRRQQVEMAVVVYRALTSDDRLIVEAPTGTGKTLAYVLAAALSRKRVAISTGTKNLQEQLFYKDIPFVRKRLFPNLKAALLKGRGNFVCHTRLQRFLKQPRLRGIGDVGSLKEIQAWYGRTMNKGSGDRAELERLADDDPIWPEVCSTVETCLGRKCPQREACFVLKMRARAAASDLMVINHHLLCSDLGVRDSGFGEVIPRYEALIVDEAHGLEEAATQHFGFHLSRFRIARLIRDTAAELKSANAEEPKFAEAFAAIDRDTRLLFDHFDDTGPSRIRLGQVSPDLAAMRDSLATRLNSLAAMLANLPESSEESAGLADRATAASRDLLTILDDDQRGEFAPWVERREGGIILHASPTHVGGLIREKLYEKIQSVVFTSATLSSGGTLTYFKSRLGLDDEPAPTEAILDSPFDHANNTMLYIPRSIPEPTSPSFVRSLGPVLADILERTQGRAFVLFTSYRNMEAAYRQIDGSAPFPLLLQGTRPKRRLLEEFRERMGSVLFATSSFWEGVDVQGEALSCVVVDRLPFAPPDDPIVAARIERIRTEGGEPFFSFQVPMAVLALKQGLGRLIRTQTDRGVLAILDTRILTRGYGRIFRDSLYECPIHRDPEAIDQFFADEPRQ